MTAAETGVVISSETMEIDVETRVEIGVFCGVGVGVRSSVDLGSDLVSVIAGIRLSLIGGVSGGFAVVCTTTVLGLGWQTQKRGFDLQTGSVWVVVRVAVACSPSRQRHRHRDGSPCRCHRSRSHSSHRGTDRRG